MKFKILLSFIFLIIFNLSCKKCELLDQTIISPIIPCEGTFYISKNVNANKDFFDFYFHEFNKPVPDPFVSTEKEGPNMIPYPFTIVSNFSAFDSIHNSYVFEYFNTVGLNGIIQYYYHDITTNTSTFSSPKNTYVSPVFLNGHLYAIRDPEDVFAEYHIVELDPFTGVELGELVSENFEPRSPFIAKYMSSTSNGTELLYFLSGTHLIEVNINSPITSKHFDIDTTYNLANAHFVQYYGLEYKRDEGSLIAIRKTIDSGDIPYTVLVSIHVLPSTTITTQIFDISVHLPTGQDNLINADFYSTTFDPCDNAYYITERQDSNSTNLIEINLDKNTFKSQTIAEYWYGWEFD
jgi:hypothetical protein